MCLVFDELELFDRVAVQASETLRVATACATCSQVVQNRLLLVQARPASY